MRRPEKSVRPVLKSACRADSEEIHSCRTGAGEESDREFPQVLVLISKEGTGKGMVITDIFGEILGEQCFLSESRKDKAQAPAPAPRCLNSLFF